MPKLSNARILRRYGAAVCLIAGVAVRSAAQVDPPQPRDEHHLRDAVIGAVLGGAAGAVIGYAAGSMGGAEPSCLSSPCEGHSFAKQGARVGLVIGIPVGAVIGWRGTFRGTSSASEKRYGLLLNRRSLIRLVEPEPDHVARSSRDLHAARRARLSW